MRVCGIVCEYDPFHRGHELHIEQTKRLLGEDTLIVCCMSGNYTQRGEPSLLPKHLRAEMALCAGADLVCELPSAYALLSAEGFASAGISVLSRLGIITDISFGAEDADTATLTDIASLLLEHDTVSRTLCELKTGISFAAARERALFSLINEKAEVISKPNNILAIEYIKALLRTGSDIVPHAVKRVGAEHNAQKASEDTLSASHIRELVRGGNIGEIKKYLPEASYSVITSALSDGMAMNDASVFGRAMYCGLLRLTPDEIKNQPDVSEGLEYRIYNAIHSCASLPEVFEAAKSKRYPYARIKRIMLRAYLGMGAELNEFPPPYCRILGFTDRGRNLLGRIREDSEIPLITKSAHIKKLPYEARRLFYGEAVATDLYNAAVPAFASITPSSEWRMNPASK